MDIQIPKVPALLVHVEAVDSVGIGVASVVDAPAVVPVGATLTVEADDREAACAGSVGPKPKQADDMGTVTDYKALVLLY